MTISVKLCNWLKRFNFFCFPILHVTYANQHIRSVARSTWTPEYREALQSYWNATLDYDCTVRDVTSEMYKSEIEDIRRVEDKLQYWATTVGLILPVIVTIYSGTLIRLWSELQGWTACSALFLAILGIGQLLASLYLSQFGGATAQREQAGISTVKSAATSSIKAADAVAIAEAIAIESNEPLLLILANCVEGARLSFIRSMVMLALALSCLLIGSRWA